MCDRRREEIGGIRQCLGEDGFEEQHRIDRRYRAIKPSPDVNGHAQISHE